MYWKIIHVKEDKKNTMTNGTYTDIMGSDCIEFIAAINTAAAATAATIPKKIREQRLI